MHRCRQLHSRRKQEWQGLCYRFYMHTHTGLLSPPQSSRIHSKKLNDSKILPPIEALCWFHASLTFRFLCYQSLFWVLFVFFFSLFVSFGFIFSSPNSFEIVFGENPFGCSSCPCISSHSQTCSLPLDIGKNKWPTYRNTWYTPYTLQQHKLGKKSQSLHGKSTPRGQAQGRSVQTGWLLRQESLWQLI